MALINVMDRRAWPAEPPPHAVIKA